MLIVGNIEYIIFILGSNYVVGDKIMVKYVLDDIEIEGKIIEVDVDGKIKKINIFIVKIIVKVKEVGEYLILGFNWIVEIFLFFFGLVVVIIFGKIIIDFGILLVEIENVEVVMIVVDF